MPNGPTSSADTAGPSAKPNTSAASRRPRLEPRLAGSARITMRRTAGAAAPTPMPAMKRPRRIGSERGAHRHQDEAGDVDEHADQHDEAGVAAVGVGGDQQLGEEPGEEPEPDDHADRRLADAVLVAVVVDDREQHAVAGGEAGHQPAEREEHEPGRRWPRFVERLVDAASMVPSAACPQSTEHRRSVAG